MYISIVIVLGAALAVMLKLRSSAEAAKPAPVKDTSNKLHWLVAEDADPLFGTWHLGARRVTAGRAPSNYIQITSPGMSRRHAAFYADGENVTLVDMSSSNGTKVNGQIVQTARLTDGDTVELAGARFTYHREGRFAANAAWASKEVGTVAENTTVMPNSMLQLRAQATYQLTGGDAAKTASQVGISVAELERLLEVS